MVHERVFIENMVTDRKLLGVLWLHSWITTGSITVFTLNFYFPPSIPSYDK
jgi:hypothetical protein